MRSELIKENKYCFKYHIKADHFLHNMVRRIVGSTVSVGKGEEANENLTMPASGLTLMNVEY